MDNLSIGSKHSWYLNVDVACVEYDGNILDAALLAANVALKSAILPHVSIHDNGAIEVVGQETTQLQFLYNPLSVSFGVFDE